ncbi:bifunctional hydroxymethylpyrimidine kinase/phosphomethylpyrimidine kinase [Ottowia sp.]|uniref:bifunctional hydroxymethylpyrimidine kinase/phosphomethylpyrimidine kinase n=1 Tax=Ottowia sp. TaxID=1898956 RepID=UPI0026128132|nr:bifunctional hydroxymethylpyrimidine kinase/phosphomethylpyrimidine kinase [Ottowia sp.]
MQKRAVWSIAGNDSGGGAGLSADLRAAEAFGVHLCPVVAAVTAQNSRAVTRVEPVSAELLDAQLAALAQDMPPAAIKTGLLGSAANVAVVARWVDRLRERAPVALVVDPVLGASTGAAFADDAALAAYRELLLPRATLVTPNRHEAGRLAGGGAAEGDVPALAAALRGTGAQAVAVTGGDDSAAAPGWSLDWIATPQASGWLALPRVATPHTHGTGCTFATSAACALALGFVPADALVLAKMATTHALAHGYTAGQGAGPVAARPGFATEPALLPAMSWDESSQFSSCLRLPDKGQSPKTCEDIGLYAIVDSAERVRQVVAAGVRTVQLRIKTPDAPDAAWHAALRQAVADALAACRAAGATLVVNDHWRLAAELGEPSHLAVHLGQEDLLALGKAGRAELAASGLKLGISSHSLWELCRAHGLAPWYAACGPVWPTLTKAMPWVPQGLDNLAWWVRMAGMPVVAIGGILEPAQLELAARSGASGVCVVRGLGDDPATTVPRWQAALAAGRAAPPLPVPVLPHPSLAP